MTTIQKVTKKKTARRPGGVKGRPRGKTTGLGIQEYWVKLFRQNAYVAKKDCMADAQITAAMKAEFPGRDSAVFDRVSSVRNKYNKGGLTGDEVSKSW
ncbi:hypothetical protein [Poriferisphaera sp. WC338]|uniref:hypothetical protein n=1 Tax=Poriferisphaera sp. WC338 TaxID=3425129 RepID=UPI003D815873